MHGGIITEVSVVAVRSTCKGRRRYRAAAAASAALTCATAERLVGKVGTFSVVPTWNIIARFVLNSDPVTTAGALAKHRLVS